MTSEKVMLTAMLLFAMMSGCVKDSDRIAEPLVSPYANQQVWAIVPLLNESGSLQADGAMVADQLARQFENATNIDVVPVNRTIAAMEASGINRLSGPGDAAQLLRLLNVDGLIVGTMTDYDPYDPPKLGLAIELYTSQRTLPGIDRPVDVRQLSRAATDGQTKPDARKRAVIPASVVSGFFDAADPHVKQQLRRYANQRGTSPRKQNDLVEHVTSPIHSDEWMKYRLSMDLYAQFVSHAMAKRLLVAESRRLTALANSTR